MNLSFSQFRPSLRVALAQINTTVGDLSGNEAKILAAIEQAKTLGVDLLAFPELAITGYPPEDLLLKPQFIEDNHKTLQRIAEATAGITVVVGFAANQNDIYNAAAVLHNGALAAVTHKIYLPNYGVFDENRYFQAGTRPLVFELNGVGVGVNICEDIWYPGGPTEIQALVGGAEIILNISASPFHAEKASHRERMLATRAADNIAIVAYCNLVGGQDELIFDGASVIFSATGDVLARGKPFEEDFVVADLDVQEVFRRRLADPRRRQERLTTQLPQPIHVALPETQPRQKSVIPAAKITPLLTGAAEIYAALTLGVRDYVTKNRFKNVVLGLSGGIDSALTAAIATDALGADCVTGVAMPSQHSSSHSLEDAEALAKNLGIQFLTIPIERAFHAYLEMLAPQFDGLPVNIAEENLQARVRGNILMGLSNKFGWLVLTTGNKSEMSVGYATLYGDMAGGFAVIKDVPKMIVYALARHRNDLETAPIPQRSIEKAPSAELRPDQFDTDSLPPYDILDPILRAYVEEDRSPAEIVGMGFDPAIVQRVVNLVDQSEYKRRQSPPGIKITTRAFGRDRRLPITNRYRAR